MNEQVVAHDGKKGDHKKGPEEEFKNTPGCEKYESVAKINATTCCKSLPKVFNKASYEECAKECENKGYCCKSDCLLKKNNIADASGKFDAVKAKAFLKAAVKDAKYVSEKLNALGLF